MGNTQTAPHDEEGLASKDSLQVQGTSASWLSSSLEEDEHETTNKVNRRMGKKRTKQNHALASDDSLGGTTAWLTFVETSIPFEDEPDDTVSSNMSPSWPVPTSQKPSPEKGFSNDVFFSDMASRSSATTEDNSSDAYFSTWTSKPRTYYGLSRRRAILAFVVLVALMLIAVGIGYTIGSKKNSSSLSSSVNSTNTGNSPPTDGTEETTPQDTPLIPIPSPTEASPQQPNPSPSPPPVNSPSDNVPPTPSPTAVPLTPSPTDSSAPGTGNVLTLVADNGMPESSYPLGLCQGDCDYDSQCQSGLKCFQRQVDEPVPGCTGSGETGMDYCYEAPPSQPVPQQPSPTEEEDPPLVLKARRGEPASAFPLGLCEGVCFRNRDCQAGLECITNDENGKVPGCSGYESDRRGYCYNPNALVDVLNMNGNLLGLCEGDCQDDDTMCQPGLTCFHREQGNERVPGCRGSGTLGYDYCYRIMTTAPTQSPAPTEALQAEGITYKPGELTGLEAGLILSTGLTAKIIAKNGTKVKYYNGQESTIPFHHRADFGATFPDTSGNNPGGWIYVSNSEMEEIGEGGVGAFTFDHDGNILNYKMLLTNTTMNCGGGRTPWDTWISCEEAGAELGWGQIYQVDPLGNREPQTLTMGSDGDRFESFAYDDRNVNQPDFYVTVDTPNGAVRKWTPDSVDWDNPWDILHGTGTLKFLYMIPEGPDGQPLVPRGALVDVADDKNINTTSSVNGTASVNVTVPDLPPLGVCEGDCDNDDDCQEGLKCFDRKNKEYVPGCTGDGTKGKDYCFDPNWDDLLSPGSFIWIDDKKEAQRNARENIPESEGIDCVDGVLYFVSKPRRTLTILDLDTMRFRRESTVHGVFEGAADQIQRILADDDGDEILYFTEEREGGTNGGIHGRNRDGQFFTILEGTRSLYESESTGLAFSPDGCHLYFAFQNNGVLFDVTRTDGLCFHGRSLDVNYHNPDAANS